MGLVEYKRKRSFKKTPEPTGGKSKKGELIFVVQKHAASRLHYDFRLELKGVLKSWAVPKGPSLNPKDKRLAMLVEDHPYDYKDFEGIIPAGNYGAGTVIIWDQGTYEPIVEAETKSEREEILKKDFEKGSMKIRMYGEKLQGEFAIVKMKGREENTWLLIKHRDEFASEDDVTEQNQSVVSGSTIEDLSSDPEAKTWKSNRSGKTTKDRTIPKKKSVERKPVTPATENAETKKLEIDFKHLLRDVREKKKQTMPENVAPMLATLVDKPFDKKGWLYEVKWDGFRAISYLTGDDAVIRSRNNKDFTKKFYPIQLALKDLELSAVFDGEIIVIDDKGRPSFNALQEWRSEADGQLMYYVFDILWLDGYNLMDVPLQERKNLLSKVLPGAGPIRLSESFEDGTALFEQADKLGLEGVLAKKANSVYKPDYRSKEWLKVKTEKHQEAIIAGYTKNENTSKKFSALLLGVYDDNKKLQFIGPVGTGFSTETQVELLKKMKKLETKKCPFDEVPDYNKPSRFRPNPPKAEVTWLKPELVAEVSYRAVGGDGGLRHPSYRGLREDKKPGDVKWDSPDANASSEGENVSPLDKKLSSGTLENERKTLLNPKDETQVRTVDGHELKFTNLSKIYWPDEGYSKRDMLNYYYQVVPYMLPYMKDRPQTLNRFPNGIKGKSFYQKDVTGKVLSWIETYKYFSEGDNREKHFLVCTNEASLLYIAGLGCIEINPWSSRTQSPDNPDWCVIDLDPGKKNTFDHVIEAARVTKEVLDVLGLPSYCKTSGSTGLHIYIPLGAKYTYEDSKEFARAIVKIINSQLPAFTSIERKVSDRNGMMYLDFLQNRPQATLAGPYSLRPKPGAPVSMPLYWDEVRKGLKIENFTIKNAISRLKETGDLFEGVLGEGINLQNALSLMQSTFQKMKK